MRCTVALALIIAASGAAQVSAQRRVGGFVPGQQRPDGDPVQIARGKAVYGISCRACHGADLRGGDMGGPNLLRSQLSLSDREGEKIIPVIQGSLQSGGMPAIPLAANDAKAVAAYVRSVLATIGGQGTPPSSKEPPTILVGDAAAGKVYFDQKCASCHSGTGDLRGGDLQGIASRISNPRMLQNAWVAGGARTGRAPAGPPSPKRTVTVSVTPPGESTVEGRLLRIDDFLVALELPDGTSRSFRRDGDRPKVEVRDPLTGHRDLLPLYTDKDVHDVTAYLVTLK